MEVILSKRSVKSSNNRSSGQSNGQKVKSFLTIFYF